MREKIAVLMGGRSLEREVSLASGRRVSDALTGWPLESSGNDASVRNLVAAAYTGRPPSASSVPGAPFAGKPPDHGRVSPMRFRANRRLPFDRTRRERQR